MALELKLKDALIFPVQHISVFIEINPQKFLYINKIQSLSFPNDIYIHFALGKELGKIVILKKHAETLCFIINLMTQRREGYTVKIFFQSIS